MALTSLRIMSATARTTLLLLLSLYSLSTHAVVISYDESVGGDLGTLGSPTNLGNLDVGTNTITGAMGVGIADGVDSFTVNLGAGLTLVSVTAQISNYMANSNGERFRDAGSLFNIVFSSNVLITLPAGTLASLQALPSFTLAMVDSVLGSTELGWDYTVSIVTRSSSVPEPGTLGLLGAGLLGLVFGRRKKAA